MKEERIQTILRAIDSIQASDLSVNKYFKIHHVPFSRKQYYTYCRILKRYGEDGLRDRREEGNATKLTQRVQDYIRFLVKHEPAISTGELRAKIHEEFSIEVSKSSVNHFRRTHGLFGAKPGTRQDSEPQRSGGGEILTGLALSSGIINVFTQAIVRRVEEIRQTEAVLKTEQSHHEPPHVREHGKFTAAYNQLQSVRETRFQSIDEKIPRKNYAAMKLLFLSEQVISRYNLALLCLPLVTSNGKISRVNRVKGNELEFLCGYNYKDATLDKYLRELKYLKVAEQFVAETAKFWVRFWKERYDEDTFFVCYYLDGHTKALWSSERHYKGNVTMLGRVMNCLENVFIHDGKGHPLYFQTFHGHADLGKHALGMMKELSKHVDEPVSVNRILVCDGAGNSVKTMRAFQDGDEYFITILDKNQVKERRLKHLGEEVPYPYGEATVVDGQIELPDSSEKGNASIYESRAVIVKWENGRQSVLVTNIPGDLLDAGEITKRYFDRWPLQEKQFRDTKNGVNIHRIVGYGKRCEPYEKMREKCNTLRERIQHLKRKLHEPLKEIEHIENELVMLYKQERALREQSVIEAGKRVLCDDKMVELKQCEKAVNKRLRQKKTLEKQHKEEMKTLRKYVQEERRIRVKDTVYRLDTELEQIMTCFKLSYANLCSVFLSECMNHETLELMTLFESIFQLEGQAVITRQERIVNLRKNPKEPRLMKKLEEALLKLNEMKMITLDGLQMQFLI